MKRICWILKDECPESKKVSKNMPKLPIEFLSPDNLEEQSFSACVTVKTERIKSRDNALIAENDMTASLFESKLSYGSLMVSKAN